MSFATAEYLRRAQSRAKSDVANKLVSMLLHELSRRINSVTGLGVTDARYTQAVGEYFGSVCCYCQRALEADRAAVEHLEGMNRFRLGLHVPGNVLVACKQCNNEKRRDDQLVNLRLANSGWESFLAHDSIRCDDSCATCRYWRAMWPADGECKAKLQDARNRITEFRSRYDACLNWSRLSQHQLREKVDKLYRDCQNFAVAQITANVDEIFSSISKSASAG